MLRVLSAIPAPGRILLGLVLVLAGFATPAAADCARVRHDIERTRDMLRNEEALLRDCNVDQVRGLIQQAIKQLGEAERRGSRGDCSRARSHVDAAQRLILKARDLCRDQDRNQDQVLDFLQRTDNVIRESSDRAASTSEDCRRLLRVAQEQQNRGWRQFRSGNHRFALSLSAGARRSCERVHRCGDGRFNADQEARKILEDTDRLLGDALRILGDESASPEASSRLDHARRMQHQAWRQARMAEPRYLLAIRLSEQARVVAARSLGRVELDLDPQGVTHMIETTRQLLDQLESSVEGSSTTARDLLRRARRLLSEAEQAHARNDDRQAVAKARTSSSLALEVAGFLDTGPEQ